MPCKSLNSGERGDSGGFPVAAGSSSISARYDVDGNKYCSLDNHQEFSGQERLKYLSVPRTKMITSPPQSINLENRKTSFRRCGIVSETMYTPSVIPVLRSRHVGSTNCMSLSSE